ncbi:MULTISPECIES: hypothetical protein [Bhargavaea]|uniref:Uncharacterized protein n=1 Tax=Bhargavaea changchunensis TaxID=2134037 RepID=A0ABW2NH16_9BACL|nr:hypothetical protein [Bhargavaea sp. CC-171006]
MKTWSNFIVLFMIVLFLVSQILTLTFLDWTLSGLSLIVMLISLIYSRQLPKWFSTVMIAIGSLILLNQQAGWDVWEEALTKNMPIVCLIIVAPILSIPIRQGKYDEAIFSLVATFKGSITLFFSFLLMLFNFIGPITNLGSIHIIHSMMNQLKLSKEFLAKVYTRGFSSINTWSPYFASVLLVIYYLDIPITRFLPYGLLLSFFQILLSTVLFSLREAPSMTVCLPDASTAVRGRKLTELSLVFAGLIGVIITLEPVVRVGVSVLVTITLMVFSVLWSVLQKRFKGFLKDMDEFRSNILPRQSNEISLFFSAGFFSVVLSGTAVADHLNLIWEQLADVSVFLLILFTIVLISAFAFIGIHQIVVVSSILASVSPVMISIDDITFAMILLSAWAIGSVVSPVAPMNVISSNLLKVNVYRVILKWNLRYAILLIGIHTMLIYVVHLLLAV